LINIRTTARYFIFCNTGWMENYKGLTSKDKISGGGSYVDQNASGHEVCNFYEYQKNVYGYVQPSGSQINISRLGASNTDESIRNITVIWTAKRPEGGTVIVGWYKNATVYRYYQNFTKQPPLHKKNKLPGYWITAKAKDVNLLSIDERTISIPRGTAGMGRSHIWYADSPDKVEFLNNVKALIKGKRAKTPVAKRNKGNDPEHNAKVEKSAIQKTIRYYEDLGYQVNSVEKDNVGWDLEAKVGRNKLLIEVKGLSGKSLSIQLTPNEFRAFSEKSQNYRLSIVTNALIKPMLAICRYSKEEQSWVVDKKPKGKVKISIIKSAAIEISI